MFNQMKISKDLEIRKEPNRYFGIEKHNNKWKFTI